MDYYTIANAIVAGICLGFGIIFLFIGLRRQDNKRLNLLFAIFALAYGATLFSGIRFHNATSIEAYVALSRRDTFFVVLAFITLTWYIAEYTQIKPRLFLWALTTLFLVTGIANLTRTNLNFDEILGLNTVTMPWGEQIAYLEASDSIWSLLFLAAQLMVLAFMVFACIRQFRRGQRGEALILSIGALWFVTALSAEILGGAGLITPIFYGEFGFLGFAVAASLEMSNEIIKAEEKIAAYRLNLEKLVNQRTAELEEAQKKLLHQAQERATIEERSRLARDLHDAVTQTIYSAALVAEALPKIWNRNPEEGQRNLAKLRQLVRGALAEMRAMLFELRPAALEAADLETLLRQLGDALTGRTQIPVTVTIEGHGDLPPQVKVAFYRISQEALNNIEKHARAEQVILSLQQTSDQAILNIQDDGLGFNPTTTPHERLGLSIMHERAEAIDAEFDIKSKRGLGTELSLSWKKH